MGEGLAMVIRQPVNIENVDLPKTQTIVRRAGPVASSLVENVDLHAIPQVASARGPIASPKRAMLRAKASRSPAPRRLVAIGLAASLCAAAGAPSRAAAAGNEATAQFSDTLETETSEPLVSLYVTALEKNEFAIAWKVTRLPCRTTRYRFLATEASIDSTQTASSEARIQMFSAKLPHGTRCGLRLPPEAAHGPMKIAVSPVQANGSAGPPDLSYSDHRVSLESFSTCLTLSGLCPGRYLLTARFTSSSGQIVLTYGFTITHIKKSATGSTRSEDASKVQSCLIP
jgi:hypothetical protein